MTLDLSFGETPPHIIDLCRQQTGRHLELTDAKKGTPTDLGFHPNSVISTFSYLTPPRELSARIIYARDFIAVRIAPAENPKEGNSRVECIHLKGLSIFKIGAPATNNQILNVFRLANGEIVDGWKKV